MLLPKLYPKVMHFVSDLGRVRHLFEKQPNGLLTAGNAPEPPVPSRPASAETCPLPRPARQFRNHPMQGVQLLARDLAALEEMPKIAHHAWAFLLIA